MSGWFSTGARLHDRWTLGGELMGPFGKPLPHVRTAADEAGIEGVVKITRSGGGVGRARLLNEIQAMTELRGRAGVLPVLDSDSDGKPWILTPRAELLGEHLGPNPDLRRVVECFRSLALTLVDLQHEGYAHRDLKPANLFYFDDAPVLGDFGLVGHARAERVTLEGEPVGSVYFMAPEARTARDGINWHQCDVFSLASCLWVMAAGEKFPPDGTIRASDPRHSLFFHGGKSAYLLSLLLEKCTDYDPWERPPTSVFAAELEAWLKVAPESSRPILKGGSRPNLWHAFGREFEARVHLGGVEKVAEKCLQELAKEIALELNRDPGHPPEEADTLSLGEEIDLSGGDPDWMPEWGPVIAARVWSDVRDIRLVLALVGVSNDQGSYLAEWQVRAKTGEGYGWQTSWYDSQPATAVLRLPSDWLLRGALGELIARNAPPSLRGSRGPSTP